MDLVKNEWLAGFQHVVARIYWDERSGLRLDTQDGDKWDHLLHQTQVDRETREEIDPEHAGARFFERLHTLLNGDYLFATEAHPEDECPYRSALVVPIRPSSAEARLAG